MKIRGYSKKDIVERGQTYRESFDQLLNELESAGAAYEEGLDINIMSTPSSSGPLTIGRERSPLNRDICTNHACRRTLSRLCALLEEMNEDIMWLHGKVEQTNKIILQMASLDMYQPVQAQQSSVSTTESKESICLPLMSISEFQRTEENLACPEFKNELHRQLATYGGQVETTLNALMSDALACCFSWSGDSKRLRIQGTRIGAILSDILMPLTLTREENNLRNQEVSKWFESVPARYGGRTGRKYRILPAL